MTLTSRGLRTRRDAFTTRQDESGRCEFGRCFKQQNHRSQSCFPLLKFLATGGLKDEQDTNRGSATFGRCRACRLRPNDSSYTDDRARPVHNLSAGGRAEISASRAPRQARRRMASHRPGNLECRATHGLAPSAGELHAYVNIASLRMAPIRSIATNTFPQRQLVNR